MRRGAAMSKDLVSPFGGAPLFADPDARALERVGVVDVGSNSVRLVVFDGAARSPAYFFNEKILCGLGAGLQETGRLNPEGRQRAKAALHRFQTLAERMGIAPLSSVATAAVRDAEDGPEFCEEIQRDIGLSLHVIDGKEEARLSAQGVLLGWPGSAGLVCDIGGASMELAMLGEEGVGRRVTSDLGPLKLMALPGGRKALRAHIREAVEHAVAQIGAGKRERLFLVGGSWRAIAKIDMDRRGYPLPVLHEYRMTAQDVRHSCEQIARNAPEQLRQRCGISSARMALVPLASQVLGELVKVLKPRDICISSYGIREGVLFEQMPEKLRLRDPLLEACWFLESKDARIPGFGASLFDFVKALFPRAKPAELRIARACCLLHDVSWRSHPDFRAELGFEMATRANLGGLTHQERIYLGLALMYRYSGKAPQPRFEALLRLLPKERQLSAEILGKAMRLGAMLWQAPGERGPELKWQPQKKLLTLSLPAEIKPLFGEVAQTRLASLASTLGGSWRCVDL